MGCKRCFDVIKSKEERLETLLEKAKLGFPPHFSSDLLDSLSYLLVKPGGKHSPKKPSSLIVLNQPRTVFWAGSVFQFV